MEGVISGLVIVDKPQGWTSHDVVARLHRLLSTRKVGHAGTLDPMATGVLVAGAGKATRLLTYIVGMKKSYTATIRLGQATLTDDAEGEILYTRPAVELHTSAEGWERVKVAVAALTGDIQQVPSSVSAIKVGGRRSYARVRAGETVELAARPVTISRFDIHDRRPAGPHGQLLDLDVSVECSSGTYIRALARDLGSALGVGGHLTALRRTAVGPYTVAQARSLEELAGCGVDAAMLGLAEAARALLPSRELSAEETRELSFGRKISSRPATTITTAEVPHAGRDGQVPVAAFSPDGTLVALLHPTVPGARHATALAVLTAAKDGKGATGGVDA